MPLHPAPIDADAVALELLTCALRGERVTDIMSRDGAVYIATDSPHEHGIVIESFELRDEPKRRSR